MVLCPLGAVNQIFAGCGVNALSDPQNPERIRYRQGYLMRRGHLPEGFERFNAL